MRREELIRRRGTRTQREVADSIGISQKTLSKIERGERNPSVNFMARICKYYGEQASVLFPDIFLK